MVSIIHRAKFIGCKKVTYYTIKDAITEGYHKIEKADDDNELRYVKWEEEEA